MALIANYARRRLGAIRVREVRRCGLAELTVDVTSSATASRSTFETYGVGEPTILFLPTWEIVHSGTWKFQVPTSRAIVGS